MKLVLYSGGYHEENQKIDEELLRLTGKPNPSLTFIPSCSQTGPDDYEEFVAHFENYKFSDFHYFPLDNPFSPTMAQRALERDIIYLSGGNTFYFLKHMQETGFISRLNAFAKNGGILTGLSAGGILMTPSIRTAGFPSFDRDRNDVRLKNLKSLNLVNFEFFPHFINTTRYIREFQKYSKTSKKPLYACPDGSGIILNDDKLTFVGPVYLFLGGQRIRL